MYVGEKHRHVMLQPQILLNDIGIVAISTTGVGFEGNTTLN